MVDHLSELIAVAGGALVVIVTSQILIVATTTRKRLRHERDGIARCMLGDETTPQTARGPSPATVAAAGDQAIAD